jgi:hypothetical protein
MVCIIVVELISIPAATNVSVEELMVCLIVAGVGRNYCSRLEKWEQSNVMSGVCPCFIRLSASFIFVVGVTSLQPSVFVLAF